ncbi:class I SAM-dependent methyltransferase [Rhodopirellula sp. P2]|uniref:class I SAM-dependent methyltransferase n=1 Tax=Rhodopirellula sp. P2 TaxID=2127060 RepID=UPI003FD0400E
MGEQSEYGFSDSSASHTSGYLWEPIITRLSHFLPVKDSTARVLDIGCGNGAFTKRLTQLGYQKVGVAPSESGIAKAKETSPEIDFHLASAYDDLQRKFGSSDAVVSLAVVEHVYSPRTYFQDGFWIPCSWWCRVYLNTFSRLLEKPFNRCNRKIRPAFLTSLGSRAH